MAEAPKLKENNQDLLDPNILLTSISDDLPSETRRLLWEDRLRLLHNPERLLRVFYTHGFYVHIDDYPLPGNFFFKMHLKPKTIT